MSSLNQKTAAVQDFLEKSARLNRLTNFEEVAAVAGRTLNAQGVRRSREPLSRDKVAQTLGRIAKSSFEENGFILPAIVVHWEDNQPGHRFGEWASQAGLLKHSTVLDVHVDQVRDAFSFYESDQHTADLFGASVDTDEDYSDETSDVEPVNGDDEDEGD